MRQFRLPAGVLAGVLSLMLVSAAAAAGKPPAGAPDPAQMVLKTSDFEHAKVDMQGYVAVDAPLESYYGRDFSEVSHRGRALDLVISEALVASKAQDAKTVVTGLTRQLSTKRGRDEFKKELEQELKEVGGTATVGKPHVLGIGDGSVEFAVTLKAKRLPTIALRLAYIRIDRVLNVVELGVLGQAPGTAIFKTLGSLVVKRTRAALAPINTVPPGISGTAQVGQQLIASTGSWSGSPTFTYQWLHCDATGGACTPIAGATASTYTPTTADVGATLRVAVTGVSASGSKSVQSSPTAVVTAAPAPPVNTAAPTISGTAQQGQTLTASPGAWTGGSPTFAYQWQRCDATATTCADVPGATATTYAVTAADAGFALRVVVTATNPLGTAKASSAPTAVVT